MDISKIMKLFKSKEGLAHLSWSIAQIPTLPDPSETLQLVFCAHTFLPPPWVVRFSLPSVVFLPRAELSLFQHISVQWPLFPIPQALLFFSKSLVLKTQGFFFSYSSSKTRNPLQSSRVTSLKSLFLQAPILRCTFPRSSWWELLVVDDSGMLVQLLLPFSSKVAAQALSKTYFFHLCIFLVPSHCQTLE